MNCWSNQLELMCNNEWLRYYWIIFALPWIWIPTHQPNSMQNVYKLSTITLITKTHLVSSFRSDIRSVYKIYPRNDLKLTSLVNCLYKDQQLMNLWLSISSLFIYIVHQVWLVFSNNIEIIYLWVQSSCFWTMMYWNNQRQFALDLDYLIKESCFMIVEEIRCNSYR